MNPTRLLAHFERISEAPDAIPRLRQFILDLAVRGKLVEQDPKDEPAAGLLKRIQRASSAKVRNKQIVVPSAAEDLERPFPAPAGWIWLRFGSIHDLVRGVTYTKSDVAGTRTPGHLPILRASNIGTSLNFENLVFVRKECVSAEQMLRRGDYLITLSSGSKDLVGKAAFVIADFRGGFGAFCGVIRLVSPVLEPFVGVFLSSRLYRNAISEGSRGIGINNLKKESLNNLLFPLPPLAEQRRIVAKVDELRKLCDRLEAAQVEREGRRDRLTAASLRRLSQSNSEGAVAVREQAHFFFRHLPRLTARPEQVKQLRQAILDLAIRGRLVSQDASDEPATGLIERIQEEKVRLLREGKLRQQESVTWIEAAEIPFRIPESWAWTNLGGILLDTFYGPRFGAHEYSEAGVPTIRTTDMTADGRIVLRHPPRVNVPDDRIEDFKCRKWDLLVTRSGSIGTMAIFDGPKLAIPSAYLIRLRFTAETWVYFIHAVLKSTYGQTALGLGTTKLAQPNINAKSLGAIFVPLPPLAEQHRIVAKVDELMALCDRLEAQLTTTQAESRRLLEAVLQEALAAA